MFGWLLIFAWSTVGESNPDWLVWLDRAETLRLSNRAAEAESAYVRALQLARVTGPADPAVAIVLHNTGFFHHQAGRVAEAERFYAPAYRWFAAHQPEYLAPLIRAVTNLGVIYAETGRWAKAEEQLRPWLAAVPDHPGDQARLHGVFASVLARQGKFEEAEPIMLQVRALIEREPYSVLQQESLAQTISNLAALEHATGRTASALANYDAALDILSGLPMRYPIVLVRTLQEAAALQPHSRAQLYYQRALSLANAHLGADHPVLVNVLSGYAKLLRQMHRGGEAKKLERRAEAIRRRYRQENHLGHTVDVKAFR